MTAIRQGLDLRIVDDDGDNLVFERNESGYVTVVPHTANFVELSPDDQKAIIAWFLHKET